ncbi:MAG TPA: DUF4232 domain-containing protein [Acidimicrobiales bacterium]
MPTTVAASTSKCLLRELRVSAGDGGAGLGHVGFPILFVNIGTSPCSLTGFPGVAAIDTHGVQLAQARRTLAGYLGGVRPGSAQPPVVELAVGEQASALIEGTDVPSGSDDSCSNYARFLVTPPDETESVTIEHGLPGCSELQIHPVVAGSTGSTR